VVFITDFPAILAEDAAGQPRRTVLLAASGIPAEHLSLFFLGQTGPFHPRQVVPTLDGVLVRYPPAAPSGLLTPFA